MPGSGSTAKAEEHFQRYVRLDATANAQDSLAAGYSFAGDYEKAQATAFAGLNLDPKLDYLYGTVAKSQIVRGNLDEAVKNLDQQEALTASEDTQVETESLRAYIDLLRGDAKAAQRRLEPLCEKLSGPEYANRMDESSMMPFWMTGVAAARRKDGRLLASMIARLEQKIEAYNVNGSNYFPVLEVLPSSPDPAGRPAQRPEHRLEPDGGRCQDQEQDGLLELHVRSGLFP